MNDRQYQRIITRLDLLEKREPPLAAEFVTTASSAADDLLVVAVGWDDGEHTFGPVRWSPIGGALPAAGDECVIVERDDGVWQVVGWWSASQGTGVAQSAVDALDARLDAIEAKRTVSGVVAANGSESSSEFSAVKNATGDYTVTFTTAFSAAPVVVVGVGITASNLNSKLKNNVAPTTSAFSVYTSNTLTGGLLDGEFTFIAHGST